MQIEIDDEDGGLEAAVEDITSRQGISADAGPEDLAATAEPTGAPVDLTEYAEYSAGTGNGAVDAPSQIPSIDVTGTEEGWVAVNLDSSILKEVQDEQSTLPPPVPKAGDATTRKVVYYADPKTDRSEDKPVQYNHPPPPALRADNEVEVTDLLPNPQQVSPPPADPDATPFRPFNPELNNPAFWSANEPIDTGVRTPLEKGPKRNTIILNPQKLKSKKKVPVEWRIGVDEDIGRVRSRKADFVYVDKTTGLMLVSDGIGDNDRSVFAAKTAVNVIAENYKESRNKDPKLDIDLVLEESIQKAHRELLKKNKFVRKHQKSADPQGIFGASIAVMVIEPSDSGAIAHFQSVGDSRIYKGSKGIFSRKLQLKQKTEDHVIEASRQSGADHLKSALGISKDDDHSYSNIINMKVDISKRKEQLKDGDVIVLCTKGAYSHLVTQKEAGRYKNYTSGRERAIRKTLASIVDAFVSPDKAAKEVTRIANVNGGAENIANVVVKFKNDIDRFNRRILTGAASVVTAAAVIIAGLTSGNYVPKADDTKSKVYAPVERRVESVQEVSPAEITGPVEYLMERPQDDWFTVETAAEDGIEEVALQGIDKQDIALEQVAAVPLNKQKNPALDKGDMSRKGKYKRVIDDLLEDKRVRSRNPEYNIRGGYTIQNLINGIFKEAGWKGGYAKVSDYPSTDRIAIEYTGKDIAGLKRLGRGKRLTPEAISMKEGDIGYEKVMYSKTFDDIPELPPEEILSWSEAGEGKEYTPYTDVAEFSPGSTYADYVSEPTCIMQDEWNTARCSMDDRMHAYKNEKLKKQWEAACRERDAIDSIEIDVVNNNYEAQWLQAKAEREAADDFEITVDDADFVQLKKAA